jgi:hypothetical protein
MLKMVSSFLSVFFSSDESLKKWGGNKISVNSIYRRGKEEEKNKNKQKIRMKLTTKTKIQG